MGPSARRVHARRSNRTGPVIWNQMCRLPESLEALSSPCNGRLLRTASMVETGQSEVTANRRLAGGQARASVERRQPRALSTKIVAIVTVFLSWLLAASGRGSTSSGDASLGSSTSSTAARAAAADLKQ